MDAHELWPRQLLRVVPEEAAAAEVPNLPQRLFGAAHQGDFPVDPAVVDVWIADDMRRSVLRAVEVVELSLQCAESRYSFGESSCGSEQWAVRIPIRKFRRARSTKGFHTRTLIKNLKFNCNILIGEFSTLEIPPPIYNSIL